MYNYNHLFYFHTVVKQGSLLLAARHLRISQPALCHQIKLLETKLDAPLFQKSGRCNVLTATGHTVFNYCEKMFEAAQQMKNQLNQSLKTTREKLRIAHSEEVAESFAMESISHFNTSRQIVQKPDFHLLAFNELELNNKKILSKIDVVLSRHPIHTHETLTNTRIDSDVFLYSGKESPDSLILLRDALEAKDPFFFKECLIVTEHGSELRTKTDSFISKWSLHFSGLIEVSSLSALTSCVRQGVGAAFAPSSCFTEQDVQNDLTNKNETLGACWKDIFYATNLCGDSSSQATQAFMRDMKIVNINS